MHNINKKEKEAKRKNLWKMMDNTSCYPHFPQYGAAATSFLLLPKNGHFYLGRNRTFLFGLDNAKDTAFYLLQIIVQ